MFLPSKLTQIIGQRATATLAKYAGRSDRGSRCFLLDGPPGVGKSASAFALCNELGVTDTAPLLVKLCASELTVETIRELFLRTFRLSFKWKVLWIEELDGLTSKQADRELKVALDPHNLPARLTIIATSNDAHKLPAAIVDRFTVLSYSGGPEFKDRAHQWLSATWTKLFPGADLPRGWMDWGCLDDSFSLRSAMARFSEAVEDMQLEVA